ncbi:hypothetical protein KBD45_00920 [Candidatus Dojkabacteria bacterium]|nr:hypothetical protein [Candidatus Dojkabacteria bacterium]
MTEAYNQNEFKNRIVKLRRQFGSISGAVVGFVTNNRFLSIKPACVHPYDGEYLENDSLLVQNKFASGWPTAQVALEEVGPNGKVCVGCQVDCFGEINVEASKALVELKRKNETGDVAVIGTNDPLLAGAIMGRPCATLKDGEHRVSYARLANPDVYRKIIEAGKEVKPVFVDVGRIGHKTPTCITCRFKCFKENGLSPQISEDKGKIDEPEEDSQLQLVDRFAYRGVHDLFNNAMNQVAAFGGMQTILEVDDPACIFLAIGLGIQFDKLTNRPYSTLGDRIKEELLNGNPTQFIKNLNSFRAELIANPGIIRKRLGEYYKSFVSIFELAEDEGEYKGVTEKIANATPDRPQIASWFVDNLPVRSDGTIPNGSLVANNVGKRRFKCLGVANRTARMKSTKEGVYAFKGFVGSGYGSRCLGCLDGYYCRVKGNKEHLDKIELEAVTTSLGFIRDNFNL